MIPFGNYIIPVIIWSSTKDKSEYINTQGKRAINFQLSLFVYSMVLCLIAIPVLLVTVLKNVSMNNVFHGDWVVDELSFSNISGMVIVGITAIGIFIMLKLAEFFLIIYASVKSSNGEDFEYPLTIPFIK